MLLCFFVLIALTSQLLMDPTDLVDEVGWKAYRMFTILANLLMGLVAAMGIPYAVDGLRTRNYRLPLWYVELLYMGTFSVVFTFLVALTVLSPMFGFYRMMIRSNTVLLHLICPLMSAALFFFIDYDHRLGFKSSVLAITPILAYAAAYLVMVFVIGEEMGGWRDHYQVSRIMEYLPLPAIVILLSAVSLALSNILRAVHNSACRRRTTSDR